MRITAISDLHGHLPTLPDECDLLLIVGDICPDYDGYRPGHGGKYGDPEGGALDQAMWLNTVFREWLENVRAENIIGIAGNHDFVFEHRTIVPDLPWIYLQDTWVDIDGIKVYGSPWVPNLPYWAFHANESALRVRWDVIPDDTDILMTHGPPNGIGDKVMMGRHVGSASLASQSLYRIRPMLHVFGHIHEARGRWGPTEEDGRIMANVSHVDVGYNPIHPPMEFDL